MVSRPTMRRNLKQQSISYVTTHSLWLSVLCAGKETVRVWEKPGRCVHTHLIISQTCFGGHIIWRICLLPCWLCALPQKRPSEADWLIILNRPHWHKDKINNLGSCVSVTVSVCSRIRTAQMEKPEESCVSHPPTYNRHHACIITWIPCAVQ